jgi:opacity protein-like surface antigen
MRMSIRPRWGSLFAGLAALLLARSAAAGDFYLTGNLAISSGAGTSGGETSFFLNRGSDQDAAPAYGGAVGFGFELAEAIPRTWQLPLPGWGVRFEFEGITGREYELLTEYEPPSQAGDGYITEVTAWTFMPNLWIDVPLHQPIAWAFGRIPILEPLTLYGGAGLGLSTVDLDTTDNVSEGHREQFLFGWQAGIGLGYEITQRVTLTAGYRYVDLGNAKATLRTPPDEDPFGSFRMDLTAHEFNAGVRVNFYSIPYPEKWALRRDAR